VANPFNYYEKQHAVDMTQIKYETDINAPVERVMNTIQIQTISKKHGLET
jgi:hypothetical protein